MTDSLVAQLEDWMQEVGHSEPADARALVAGLVLPRRSMGWRSSGAMIAKVAMAVVVVVVVGVGVANLGNVGGSGRSPIVGPSSTPDPCPAALVEGELVTSDTAGLALLDTDGITREVVWPDGYYVSQRPPTTALLDAGGMAVAFAGDRVQIGGGATGIDGALVACGGITVVSRPSPTGSPAAEGPSEQPSNGAPVIDCGRISPAACQTAIALGRAAARPDDMRDTPLIVVDDTCPPATLCDRKYPFDAMVVFVTAGADTTGWYAFQVTGLAVDTPTEARRWPSEVPTHIASRISSALPGGTAEPSAPGSPATSTVLVGDWRADCFGVADADCIGASERFVNLLARSGSSVFRQSQGVLSVEPRPICPSVPEWADGTYCWQVSAPGSLKGDGLPWCMVIARRGSDTRYPSFGAVGGDSGAGRFEMPEGWPSCTFESADVMPASRSNPTKDALAALSACQIGDLDLVPFDKVTGMGRIERAADLTHYLPLSGLEPQLSESGPVWIVTVDADLPQPGAGETWVNPTCVVTSSGAGWLATGPVRNDANGVVSQPPTPPMIPDRSLPTLAP